MQRSDKDLCEIITLLQKDKVELSVSEKHFVKDYELDRGKLFRRVTEDGTMQLRYVLPKSMRKAICVEFHNLSGHFGLDRTIAKIRKVYWFLGMRRYVRQHIRSCFKCIIAKIPGGRSPGELHPLPVPRRPFYRVHMDHCGPLVETRRGNCHILVMIDAFSRFVRLFAVKSTKTVTNLKRVKTFVQTYGIPNQIVTDRGTCFTSEAFKQYCEDIGTKHILISPRHPQGNGMVERVMRTLVPTIVSSLEANEEWDQKVVEVEQHLNTAINQHTRKAPYEVLMGYIPVFHDNRMEDIVSSDKQATWRPVAELQEEIRKKCIEAQQKYKRNYDRRRWKGEEFNCGDIVAMKWAPIATGQPTKLQPKYKCPFVITEKLPASTYRITSIVGSGERSYKATAHISQLKIYRNPDDETESDGEDTLEKDLDPGEKTQITDEDKRDETHETDFNPVEQTEPEEDDAPKRSKRLRKVPARYQDYVTSSFHQGVKASGEAEC